MGQDARLWWAGIWLLEVLSLGNDIKQCPITVTERLSQVFRIMLRLTLWCVSSLGPMELHIIVSKLALCMCPVGFSRISGVQGI